MIAYREPPLTRTIQFEYHRPGKQTVVYEETLVLDRPDMKVLLQDHYSGQDVTVNGAVILEHAAPIMWFIITESWHDIGRFHLADGSFTGWYTNLSKPVQYEGDHWVGNDLFLDLWQPAQGEPAWLDEDEFNSAVKTRLLDEATSRRVLNERALIELQLREGAWPPPVARDMDLQQARDLLRALEG